MGTLELPWASLGPHPRVEMTPSKQFAGPLPRRVWAFSPEDRDRQPGQAKLGVRLQQKCGAKAPNLARFLWPADWLPWRGVHCAQLSRRWRGGAALAPPPPQAPPPQVDGSGSWDCSDAGPQRAASSGWSAQTNTRAPDAADTRRSSSVALTPPSAPSAPLAPTAEESQRERPSAHSGPGTPPHTHAATAASGAGGVSGEAEVCTPSPAPPNSVPGGADLVSIFGRTAARAPAGHRHLVSQERSAGAGGPRRVRGGRASGLGP
ncbi:uncharacterized protein LOC125927533 [Panthera uncia]|uniref:uncharacterized protein LOC125927533 n=1 Tax=Panthera uncia TaxID=29064 RepID=UPI0020FF90CA|nr:uncharacterized protein LOC125927533 [Panthera uncia]